MAGPLVSTLLLCPSLGSGVKAEQGVQCTCWWTWRESNPRPRFLLSKGITTILPALRPILYFFLRALRVARAARAAIFFTRPCVMMYSLYTKNIVMCYLYMKWTHESNNSVYNKYIYNGGSESSFFKGNQNGRSKSRS